MTDFDAGRTISFRFLPKSVISGTIAVFDRLSLIFIRLRIGPNAVTALGLLAGLAAGLLFALERPFAAAGLIAVCGLFDVLDGKVAVNGRKTSKFGALFDSTLDRYSEFFIYFGLAVHFREGWGVWVAFFAILGSTMVSYTRARAEGLGFDCRVGIMQRAERMILLFAGSLLGAACGAFDPVLLAVLAAIALVSNITAVQRVFHVRALERRRNSSPEVPS